ncbi:1-phosphofructokinase [Paenibacillus elgii]|uniref:1-phosphofructokinase n=1 Tax=Paenibacillus elgii TaxID=189691 RepID=UPI00203D0321|nr:1-phosphofructokinase [Paenibacillus elgii]MCM3267203.1 1-phosphofructokinase [Paenibacillus elgii]
MIVTVTLNAAIDKTYHLPALAAGQVSRVDRVYAEPGGKGINVARVVALQGVPVLATGFAGGSNGDFIERGLTRQGIAHDFVKIEGESRICLNIMDQDGVSTELLEPGPTIAGQEMEAMRQKLALLAARAKVVAFSGSLPAGVPKSFYAELIGIAQKQGAVVFLDTSGEALMQGAEAKPYFIKPNEDEIAQWLGHSIEDENALKQGLLRLNEAGLSCISVSMGAKGSLAAFRGTCYRVRAPKVDAVNAVGSGDAYVAGMAIGTAQGLPIEECLRLATASGTANALTARAGYVEPEDVKRLLGEVVVERIGG